MGGFPSYTLTLLHSYTQNSQVEKKCDPQPTTNNVDTRDPIGASPQGRTTFRIIVIGMYFSVILSSFSLTGCRYILQETYIFQLSSISSLFMWRRGFTMIFLGLPNDGIPKSKNLVRLEPIFCHCQSGGKFSLLGWMVGLEGGNWPGYLLPL